jgi:hypothetical protein
MDRDALILNKNDSSVDGQRGGGSHGGRDEQNLGRNKVKRKF